MSQGNKPTIDESSVTGGVAEHFFEGVFQRPNWLTRKQTPDVFIDYVVEAVENGEPTGKHFASQVKGTQSRKTGKLALKFPAKTKHIRYWLHDYPHPVFLFLMDVKSRTGHWLFVQKYAQDKINAAALQKRAKITLKFSPQDSLGDMKRFRAALQSAEAYVRDLHPGSVQSAMLAEQRRLEARYPGTTVSIAATDQFLKYQISQTAPNLGGMKLKVSYPERTAAVSQCLQMGQSFEVKASELQAEDSPALTKLLQDLGDSPIRINAAHKLKGCMQFNVATASGPAVIQIDGEWLLAPKRLSFSGQLPESPLFVDYTQHKEDSPGEAYASVTFTFQFKEWQGQPIQALAYFTELQRLAQCSEFTVRCLLRGNQLWPPETISLSRPGLVQVADSLSWLDRCIQAAKFLGANPAFPDPETINADETASKNTQLMLKLIESGAHEQSYAGEVLSMSAEGSPGEKCFPVGQREVKITWTESCREIDFFGVRIPFGPLRHTWTDLEAIASRPVDTIRTDMTFCGGPQSVWRIEYQRPSGPPSAHAA